MGRGRPLCGCICLQSQTPHNPARTSAGTNDDRRLLCRDGNGRKMDDSEADRILFVFMDPPRSASTKGDAGLSSASE